MKRKETKYIVIHCSATRPYEDIGLKEIDEWHRAPPRNWKKIGYHLVIRRGGLLEHGRHLNEVGAHAYGYNRISVGICLVGGLDRSGRPDDNFDSKQWETLRSVLIMLEALYPGAEILGHRDLSPDIDGDGIIEPWEWLKNCPCFDVKKWVEQNLHKSV